MCPHIRKASGFKGVEEEDYRFVSYSRHDAQFAAHVRKRFAHKGVSLWRDLSEMQEGREWWDQIVAALQNVEYLF